MRLVCTLCFFVSFFFTLNVAAQLPKTPDGIKQPRILILLDGSSSMLAEWGDKMPRFKAAGNIVSMLMDSVYKVNNQVEFGLRVYGHQYPAQENNCTDTRREVMFSKDNYTQMALRIASLKPSGVSPIAYSLQEAANNDLEDELNNAYSIILISDGGESCGGNVCDVVKNLIDRKIFFKSYVISLVDNIPDRNKYLCLGDNIIAIKEADIVPAIQYIMKDYRPLLTKQIIVPSQPAAAVPEHTPDIRTLNIPRSLSDKAVIKTLPVVLKDNVPQLYYYKPVLKPLRSKPWPMARIEKDPEPVVAVVPPPVPQPVKDPVPAAVTLSPPAKKDSVVVVNTPPPVSTPVKDPVPPVVAPVPAAVKGIPPAKKDSVVAVNNPPPVTKPAKDTATRPVVVIKTLPPVVTAVKNVPVKSTGNGPKPLPFTISAEDAAQTTLEIYFTDGHGTFYKSTPKLQLANASGAVVKQFYRTIDAVGNPDPQDIAAGTYTLLIPGKSNAQLKNVIVQPGKRNKIVAVVTNGSLIFRYEGAADRPVSEFEALVNILFEPGPTVKQRCNVELEYAPGNYHIEMSTLPLQKVNVDIDFGSTTVLTIKQPGYVQFMNTAPIGTVSLYYQLGDQFARFHIMDLNGNAEAQKLRLQPGPYEVHWVKNPALPYGTETVQRFQVQPNAVTEILLH